MTEIKEMKIGSGKRTDENGHKVKINGYAPRCGKSLAELLKEHEEVKIVAMGEASVNNAVKAIAYAQTNLREVAKDALIDDVRFEDTPLVRKTGDEVNARLVAIIVKLV